MSLSHICSTSLASERTIYSIVPSVLPDFPYFIFPNMFYDIHQYNPHKLEACFKLAFYANSGQTFSFVKLVLVLFCFCFLLKQLLHLQPHTLWNQFLLQKDRWYPFYMSICRAQVLLFQRFFDYTSNTSKSSGTYRFP